MDVKSDLIKMTIKNLDVVEQSIKIMEDVDNKFCDIIDKKLNVLTKKIFSQWECSNYFAENEDFSFWPEDWNSHKTNGLQKVYFALEAIKDDRLHWLSCFAGISGGECGIAFRIDSSQCKVSAEDIKRDLSEFCFENNVKLKEAGFEHDGEGLIYHPFKLDINLVADSWPNPGQDVFQPYVDALLDIKKAMPVFDEYVKRIKI